jgi:hypothetical protein
LAESGHVDAGVEDGEERELGEQEDSRDSVVVDMRIGSNRELEERAPESYKVKDTIEQRFSRC